MKQNWKKGVMTAGAFACMAACSLFGKMDANAATAATDLKQTEDSKNSVRVEWNGALDDEEYYVEISEDQQNWVEKDKSSANFKNSSLYGLNAGSTYYVRVKTEAADGTTAYSEAIDVVTAPSGEITNFIQKDATASSVSLSWNKVDNANLYKLEYYDKGNGAYIEEATTTENSYKKSGLNASFISESFQVHACRKSQAGYVAEGNYDYVSSVRTIPGKVTGVRKNEWWRGKNKNYLYLTWKESTGVKGYQIKVYDTKNKCIDTYNADYNWIYIYELSGKSCATVKIRPYISINGVTKYGAWSSAKNVVPEVYSQFTKNKSSLSISWQKVTGATGYDIYVKTAYNGAYKKAASVSSKKNAYKLTKFKGKKIKSSNTYYVMVVAKQKVGSKTYTSNPD